MTDAKGWQKLTLPLARWAKKEAFHLWKTNGRSKNPDNTYTINKKKTTIELRKKCRLEIAEKRIQERQNIINARSGDSTLFYKLIK